MNNYAIVLFLSAIANLALGLYVIRKRPNSRVHRLFGYLAFMISVWVVSNGVDKVWFFYPWPHLSYGLGALIPSFMLWWVSELTGLKTKKGWLRAIFFVSFLLLGASVIPDFIISPQEPHTFGFIAKPGHGFIPFFAFVLSVFFWSIGKLVIVWKRSSALRRTQLSYIILAVIIPVGIVAVADFLLSLLGVFQLAPFDALTSFIFLGLVTYAITRYRFMDIRIVLRKGIVQVFAFMIVVALYVYLILFLQSRVAQEVRTAREIQNPNTFLLIAIVLTALTIEPLRRLVARFVNQFVFKRKNGHKLEVQIQRGGSMINLRQLQNSIGQYLKERFNISHVQLVVLNRRTGAWEDADGNDIFDAQSPLVQYLNLRKEVLVLEEIPYLIEERPDAEVGTLKECQLQLEKMNVGVAQPLKGFNDEILATILIPKKISRRPFSTEDIESLNRLSNVAGPIVASAVMYKEIVSTIQKDEHKDK